MQQQPVVVATPVATPQATVVNVIPVAPAAAATTTTGTPPQGFQATYSGAAQVTPICTRFQQPKQHKNNKKPCTCIIFIMATFVLLAGLSMYFTAKSNQAILDQYPAVDIFDQRTCKVLSHTVRSDSRSYCCENNSNGCKRTCYACYDIFRYTFTQVGDSVKAESQGNWQSSELEKLRDETTCEETNKGVSSPHFEHSKSRNCWWFRDTPGLIVNTAHECLTLADKSGDSDSGCLTGYPACGNHECFVLEDPIAIAQDATTLNSNLVTAGIVCFVVCVLGCMVGSYCATRPN